MSSEETTTRAKAIVKRPRSTRIAALKEKAVVEPAVEQPSKPRGRGRPPKVSGTPPKVSGRPRGRPRKNPVAVAKSSSDDDEDEEGSEDETEYVVEKILAQRWLRKKLQYLVKWADYDESANSWEPAENLEDTLALDTFLAEQAAAEAANATTVISPLHPPELGTAPVEEAST